MTNESSKNIRSSASADTIAAKDKVVPTSNKRRTININIFAYMFIGLILLFGTCGLAQSIGQWSTSGKVTITGEKVTATGADPAEIRGFMTIKEVLAGYKVSWEEFSKQFNLPTDTSLDSPLNTLEKAAPGFSVTNVRTWLTQRAKN